MKRILGISLLFVFFLTGCGSNEDDKVIDDLSVSFVPSAPADEILDAAAPLEDMLKDELSKSGYTVKNVDIEVGTTYEAVGEALTTGSTDIALIPGGTYVMYENDGAELALTATRDALSVDSEKPADWNKAPTEYTDDSSTSYRSLIVAGPSEYGQKLSDKVKDGKELTYDDLAKAQWCVQSSSSSAGYLYPSLWLTENYDKSISDLPNQVEIKGYGEAVSRLASEQCDVAPMYADARMDNQASWNDDQGNIFKATNVIGVTDPIMNDTISVSTESDVYSKDFLKAVQDAFMDIASTKEGLATVKPYSHTGYEIGNPDDYDAERKVQVDVISSLNQ